MPSPLELTAVVVSLYTAGRLYIRSYIMQVKITYYIYIRTRRRRRRRVLRYPLYIIYTHCHVRVTSC